MWGSGSVPTSFSTPGFEPGAVARAAAIAHFPLFLEGNLLKTARRITQRLKSRLVVMIHNNIFTIKIMVIVKCCNVYSHCYRTLYFKTNLTFVYEEDQDFNFSRRASNWKNEIVLQDGLVVASRRIWRRILFAFFLHSRDDLQRSERFRIYILIWQINNTKI